jgi:hypothetical protein
LNIVALPAGSRSFTDEANTIIANLTEKGEHAFGGGAGPLFILSEAGDKFTYTAGDLEVIPFAIPARQG